MKLLERGQQIALALIMSMVFSGCGQEMPDMKTPPPIVSVMHVAPRNLEKSDDLTGRVVATRVAEIRAQVSGIVQKKLFEEGTKVYLGQHLFQINSAPFKADVDMAAAALHKSEVLLNQAKKQAARLETLVESEAISAQVYEDAISKRDQAAAEVAQAKAELSRKKLDLDFATISAPISGRIDQAIISEGAFIGPNETTPLARIQQIDQVYVDVRQSATSLDFLQGATQSNDKKNKNLKVEILLDNRQLYNINAHVLFSGISVDEGTGDVLLRVMVENKEHKLLPGMFVRVRITHSTLVNVLAVPQQAVLRSSGETSVWTLDQNNKVRRMKVELGELINRSYHILSGLKAGDKVVVEGLDRMSDGAEVTPRHWQDRSPKTLTPSKISIDEISISDTQLT